MKAKIRNVFIDFDCIWLTGSSNAMKKLLTGSAYMIRFSRILGILFLILGFILSLYGYFTEGDPMYAVSLGKNINLIWGMVLMGVGFLFGISSLIPDRS